MVSSAGSSRGHRGVPHAVVGQASPGTTHWGMRKRGQFRLEALVATPPPIDRVAGRTRRGTQATVRSLARYGGLALSTPFDRPVLRRPDSCPRLIGRPTVDSNTR